MTSQVRLVAVTHMTFTGKVASEMARINEIDRDVLDALSGAEKLKALLRSRGLELQGFAEKHNHWVANVSRCIHGKQERPEIRDDLAAELGLTRKHIDSLISQQVVTEGAA